jgi:hypothetical protein
MSRITTWSTCALLAASMMLSSTAWAQDASVSPDGLNESVTRDRGPATLFGPGKSPAIGGYGGVGVMYSRVDHNNVALVCGQGALLLDHQFSVGLAGCGMPSRVDGSAYTGVRDDRLELGYGGLMLRYNLLWRDVVNVSLGGIVGGGGVAIGQWNDRDWEDDQDMRMHDAIFVAEPQATVDVNVTRWFRAGIGGGYRFVSGTNTPGLSNTEVGGPTAGAHLLFGWF